MHTVNFLLACKVEADCKDRRHSRDVSLQQIEFHFGSPQDAAELEKENQQTKIGISMLFAFRIREWAPSTRCEHALRSCWCPSALQGLMLLMESFCLDFKFPLASRIVSLGFDCLVAVFD